VVKGNTITGNGYGGYDPAWSAGGMKTAGSTGQVVDSNTVYGNNGPGLWCDIGCTGITFSNNTAYDNAGPGVFFEISNGAKITGNRLWRNAGFGQVYVSSSANAEVANNVIAWGAGPLPGNTAGGIVVSSQKRSDLSFNQVGPINNSVHNNTLIAPAQTTGLLSWYQDLCTSEPWCVLYLPTSRNTASNNSFWWPGTEDGSQRFYWANASYPSLVGFNLATNSASAYMSDALKTQVLAASSMPATAGGIPATPTPTSAPSPSPTSTPATPTRTATPVRTQTPTPTTSCFVWTRQGSTYAWVQKPSSFCQPG
jgi:parallel beta-helix repeat protein